MVAQRLHQLGSRMNLDLPLGNSPAVLSRSLAKLNARLDELLPTPARSPGKLADLGPPPLQLRALLWKLGVPDYAEPGLKPLELVERLEENLTRSRLLKE